MHSRIIAHWFFFMILTLLVGCLSHSEPIRTESLQATTSEAPARSEETDPVETTLAPSATAVAQADPLPEPPPSETDRASHKPEPITPPSAKPPSSVKKRIIPGVNKPNALELSKDGIHDPDNPALATMQNPSQALSALPRGQWKEIDWMLALKRGKIKPRAGLKAGERMELLDSDIIMTNTKSMPHVRFPHSSHTQWLACSNCHPDIFQPKKGSNPIHMNAILRGQFCGVCHGKVAFSSYICQRCHSVTHKGSPKAWWK